MNTTKLILLITTFVWVNQTYAQYQSIHFDGHNRTYLVHLPTEYTEATDLPLLIAMHGGFGNAYSMQNLSQLSDKADAENFIVVYPEGIEGGPFNISSWNAGWCCGWSSRNDIDDVGFINALLDSLIDDYAIDTQRIYATGMSNGGFMAYRLACELSDRIAAIAPVSASMSMNACNTERPVPVISFHSYQDTNIPSNGGIGSGASKHHNPSQDSILNVWSNNNSCSSTSDTLVKNAEYTLVQWSDCDCGTKIHHYITEDGGHTWPLGDATSNYIHATDSMWLFLEQFSLDCPASPILSLDDLPNDFVNVFPNPTSGFLKVNVDISYQHINISIYNFLGEKILDARDRTRFNLRRFPTGTYSMVISLDHQIKTSKVVKIK